MIRGQMVDHRIPENLQQVFHSFFGSCDGGMSGMPSFRRCVGPDIRNAVHVTLSRTRGGNQPLPKLVTQPFLRRKHLSSPLGCFNYSQPLSASATTMSTWGIGANDVSEQTQALKDAASSKGMSVLSTDWAAPGLPQHSETENAGLRNKLMKRDTELSELKLTLNETLRKVCTVHYHSA